jgi:hypothetical protein
MYTNKRYERFADTYDLLAEIAGEYLKKIDEKCIDYAD